MTGLLVLPASFSRFGRALPWCRSEFGPDTDSAPERVRVRVIYLKILPSGA